MAVGRELGNKRITRGFQAFKEIDSFNSNIESWCLADEGDQKSNEKLMRPNIMQQQYQIY